jgi:putative methyltransferase (TIGR04325 family)
MSEPAVLIRRAGRKLRRIGEVAWPQGRAVSVRDLARPLPPIGQRLAPPYFVGCFDNFAAADSGENPYDAQPWVETAEFVARDLIERRADPGFAVASHLMPFVTLIADLGARQGRVSVLDFGGGLGDNFLQAEAVLEPALKAGVTWHIVDTPRNCDAGRTLLAGFADRVRFHSPAPGENLRAALGADVDATLLCGTLMYIDDWKGLLRELAALTARHLYITRSPAIRAAPTFYVRQLLAPSAGPWAGRFVGSLAMAVLNPAEIGAELAAAGFEACYFAPLFAYGPEIATVNAPYNRIVQAMSLYVRTEPQRKAR